MQPIRRRAIVVVPLTPMRWRRRRREDQAAAVATRVLIVDDHQVFADALAARLQLEGWGPITTAVNAADAMAALVKHQPHLLVLDAVIGADDGIELLERVRLRQPDLPVVMVTAHEDADTAARSVRAGASALVGKSAPTDELIEAFHAVLAGEARLPKRLLAPVLRALQEAPRFNEWQERVNVLTPREQEILALLVAGRDRASIAEELVVSINTVRTHTKNILAKLDVHSSIEAVSIALRAGMRPAKARATAGR